ncbi:unnamed protein product [Lactuca saligna]|uniref:Uncharacterized protein n=1 Tax=Lactuca saligna TaxID=75948 RepID=A0AA36EG66_LACSI|nr:unnamed protein product [Lactuca saligna]
MFAVAEAKISLEMAMCSHYQGKLCHREVHLLETFPPPIFEKRMWELAELLSAEGENSGSSRPASPSQPEKVMLLSGKKRSLRVVLSSNEETESDEMGLRPDKMCNMVSIPKLLGVITDVLGDNFSVPRQKEIVVVPIFLKTSPSLFTSSPSVDPSSCYMLGRHAFDIRMNGPFFLTKEGMEFSIFCNHLPSLLDLTLTRSSELHPGTPSRM